MEFPAINYSNIVINMNIIIIVNIIHIDIQLISADDCRAFQLSPFATLEVLMRPSRAFSLPRRLPRSGSW